MRIFTGQSLNGQITIGTLHFYHRDLPAVQRVSQRTAEEEARRYLWARKQSVLQLAALYDRAVEDVGDETASIFAIHAMLLEDGDFNAQIKQMLRTEGTTAEYAVRTVGQRVARTFSDMDSAYMRERAADILDITRRMELHLLHVSPHRKLERPSILVAESFLPSEVMELDRSHLLGLVFTRDGVTSHTAQLLREYHIPAMAKIDLRPEWEGRLTLMDGFTQTLYLDPDDALMEQLRLTYQEGGKPAEAGV